MLNLDQKLLELVSNTIRFLSADGVQKANSGHPGMPMGMAEIAAVLWLKHLRFNPEVPLWLGRDRFVLSNGHGSMLLYSMLHLCGYDVSLDDLKSFRQWESLTPGHPEYAVTPGVECTTGPLGQGIANACGMALGQKIMESCYASDSINPFSHRVFCFCGDGCLMEGISSEASSFAGHLGLGNLILIYDDNHITIAGKTELAFSEEVEKRYEAYGWHVQKIDGHNFEEIDKALLQAVNETSRPSIILARTVIGKGSPNKAGFADVHGSPLGAEEIKAAKSACGFPSDKEFYIPEAVREVFGNRLTKLKSEYEKWQQDFIKWRLQDSALAARLESQLLMELPEDLQSRLISALPTDGKPVATRKLSQSVLQAASSCVSCLIGGSADLEPSTLTLIKKSTSISKDNLSGLNIHFGVREHAMAAIMNGLSYYGGFLPYGSTFFVFLDYLRPALRLSALAKLPVLYIFTHDSIFVGEDGPTHQPIEQLAILRATPNAWTFRPADGLETAVCYAQALERRDGPCAMVLSRQNITPFERRADFRADDIRRGAYSVMEPETGVNPQIVFVATGSEVSLAVAVAKLLNPVPIRVVSMPCAEIFMLQPKEYKDTLLPYEASKVVLELGSTFGWYGLVQGSPENTLVIGLDHFGASAPYNVLAEKFGWTVDQIAEKVQKKCLRSSINCD